MIKVMERTVIKQAQKEISRVLDKYSLSWREVFFDIDEEIWREFEPEMKDIRRRLFRKRYPRLYEKIRFQK